MTKDERRGLQAEVDALEPIAERMRFLWLLGERPSLDELQDWGTALGDIHARMDSCLMWCGVEDEDEEEDDASAAGEKNADGQEGEGVSR
jgi:hypothetical protein